MFELGFNEFLSGIRKNILAVIQLILVYVVAIYALSAIKSQMKLFVPVNQFLDDTGIYVWSMIADENGNPLDEKGLEGLLEGVENINYVFAASLFEDGDTPLMYNILSANPYYDMELTSGKMCDEVPAREGEIRAVVCGNRDVEVGELLHIKRGNEEIAIRVTGTFSPDEWIYGKLGKVSIDSSFNYRSYYTSYNELYSSEYDLCEYFIMVADKEDMIAADLQYMDRLVTFDFFDDISEESLKNNQEILKEHDILITRDYNYTESASTLTKELMKIKLLPIIVVFIIIFVISMISILATSAVTFSYEKFNYGVYFITGNNWKNTLKLIMVKWGIQTTVSLLIAIGITFILNATTVINGVKIDISVSHVIVIAIIMMLQILAAIIMPYRMLRKTQPISIFKENKS